MPRKPKYYCVRVSDGESIYDDWISRVDDFVLNSQKKKRVQKQRPTVNLDTKIPYNSKSLMLAWEYSSGFYSFTADDKKEIIGICYSDENLENYYD